MITSPRLIFVVVGTASAMALAFIVTLAVLMFTAPVTQFSEPGVVLFDKLLAAFVTAGMSAMSFLFGTLVNTRSQAAPPSPPTEAKIINDKTAPVPTEPQ